MMKTQIFHHAKIPIFKTFSKRNQIVHDIITMQLISTFNTSQHIIFQKFQYKTRPIITFGPKSLKLLPHSIMNLNTISLPGQVKPVKFHGFVDNKQEMGDEALNEGCNSVPTAHDFTNKYHHLVQSPILHVHMGVAAGMNCIIAFHYLLLAPSTFS